MEVIRSDYEANDFMRYCPSMSAPNKAGHPSKGNRKLSALEISQGKKKKPKPLTRFCQICRGFSHQSIDCWHQEKNRKHRPKAWTTEQAVIEEGSEEDVDEEGGEEDMDEEGGEEDVDKVTEEGTEGTADSGMSLCLDQEMSLCLDFRINFFSGPFASIHISLRHFSRRASWQALHRSPR